MTTPKKQHQQGNTTTKHKKEVKIKSDSESYCLTHHHRKKPTSTTCSRHISHAENSHHTGHSATMHNRPTTTLQSQICAALRDATLHRPPQRNNVSTNDQPHLAIIRFTTAPTTHHERPLISTILVA
ncbi:unnamed protein product [Vicia faba]|uniref:Uncharacterized protein n=1 Tax=Vicia faba TaxID=3906 RepID=A0AAV0ZIG9_VICFA|nr:unnamed protein product [Vicia faba]